MKPNKWYVALMLLGAALNVLAKDAAPSGGSKPYPDNVKRERRQAVAPEPSDLGAKWQPYLRWHRDATALRRADAGLNGRQTFLQL